MQDHDMIIEYLYIGNKKAAEYNNSKFSLIVNCTLDIPFQNNINSIRIPVKDDPLECNKFIQYLNETNVLKKINNHILNKQHVLVHCSQGSQRSCALVACYMIKYYNLTLNETISFIKKQRPIAFFGQINFINAIDFFQKNT